METHPVDPRDIGWEQESAVYRVYFWDRANVASHEYEVTGAGLDEALGWARGRAEEEGWGYTFYVKVVDTEGAGLVRLDGVVGTRSPTRDGPRPPPRRGRRSHHVPTAGPARCARGRPSVIGSGPGQLWQGRTHWTYWKCTFGFGPCRTTGAMPNWSTAATVSCGREQLGSG
jgi:hypothetical protein